MENDVQKMKKAFREIISLCSERDYPVGELVEIEKIADEALSIPLRNCDTLETYADFVDAWNKYVTSRKSDFGSEPDVSRFLLWLSQPNNKEEGNGKD